MDSPIYGEWTPMTVKADTDATFTSNPEVQGGQLCYRGTRITKRALWGYWQAGFTLERTHRAFPDIPVDALRGIFAGFEREWHKRPRYPDGAVVMDEHVTAEHVAELAAEVERLRAEVQHLGEMLEAAKAMFPPELGLMFSALAAKMHRDPEIDAVVAEIIADGAYDD